MKFTRKCQIVLSEDDTTSPKQLRFSEDLETIDSGSTGLLKDGGGTTITIPINTTEFPLPMPQITTGKYLYLYADKAFSLKLGGSGAPAMAMLSKKANELWFDYTSPPLITTTTEAVRLTYCIAGD